MPNLATSKRTGRSPYFCSMKLFILRPGRTAPKVLLLMALLLLGHEIISAQSLEKNAAAGAVFRVVPLGVKGGLDESNLSSYLVGPQGSPDLVCLDAGTLHYGIQKALDSGAFAGMGGSGKEGAGKMNAGAGQAEGEAGGLSVTDILKNNIKAYFISHAHLDHVAGLIINSPDDGPKPVYGLSSCLEILRDKYFTWESWANFGDQGEKPLLNKYHYVPMSPGRETAIEHTAFAVTAFPLSHVAPYQSTAFLLRKGDAFLLYLGDTGADEVEHSDKLALLWQAVAPLIKAGKLKAIFIEVSFPDEQPDKLLFGHLTPRLLMKEMKTLGGLTGEAALKGLPLVITHIKPSGDQERIIKKQLVENNHFQLQLVFPQQGSPLAF